MDGEDQDRHLIDMPHAAFMVCPEEAVTAFQAKFGHLKLHFMRVGGRDENNWCCYDIVREGVDKGTGLANLCEAMGITLAQAVAAGDSANDIGMLRAAAWAAAWTTAAPTPKLPPTGSSGMSGRTAWPP